MKLLRTYAPETDRIPAGFVLVNRRKMLHYPEGYRLGLTTEGHVFHESEMSIGSFFSGKPIRQIPAQGMQMYFKLLPQAKIETLPAIEYDPEFETFAHPFIDIWYLKMETGEWKTIILENDLQPAGITFVSNLVQKLITL